MDDIIARAAAQEDQEDTWDAPRSDPLDVDMAEDGEAVIHDISSIPLDQLQFRLADVFHHSGPPSLSIAVSVSGSGGDITGPEREIHGLA